MLYNNFDRSMLKATSFVVKNTSCKNIMKYFTTTKM